MTVNGECRKKTIDLIPAEAGHTAALGQVKVLLSLISPFHVSTDILHQKMTETCASAHIGGVNIVLLEGITPDIQYVRSSLHLPAN